MSRFLFSRNDRVVCEDGSVGTVLAIGWDGEHSRAICFVRLDKGVQRWMFEDTLTAT
jgi:hypothetical protein